MQKNRGEGQRGHETVASANSIVERASQANSAVLIGPGANAIYLEYLRSGGSAHNLGEALVAASSETTARMVLGDLMEELLKGKSKSEK